MRAAFRRLLPVLLAANMAMGLLHGASLTIASADAKTAHVSPHRHHASMMADSMPADPAVPDDHKAHSSMLPSCPLANVAAVTPPGLTVVTYESDVAVGRQLLPALKSADPRLLDPPPRLAA